MTDPTNVTANDDSASEVSEERREFERSFDAPATAPAVSYLSSEQKLEWPDLVVAIVALCAWFILFSGGGLISTVRYRAAIGGTDPLSFFETVKAWYIVVMFWLVTNIGLLACISALLGAVGRRVGFTTATASEDNVIRHVAEKHVGLYYGCAIMRGFGVYSLFLAGLFVIGGENAAFPTQAQSYLQFASLLSIAGFYAGYDPVLFSGLLSRAKKLMDALPG